VIDYIHGRDKLVLMTASQSSRKLSGSIRKSSWVSSALLINSTRNLTGSELSSLAERMVNSTDAVEAARVREAIVRGFYGQGYDA